MGKCLQITLFLIRLILRGVIPAVVLRFMLLYENFKINKFIDY
jgi:hypothetical protein